jgi:hypothetical protein
VSDGRPTLTSVHTLSCLLQMDIVQETTCITDMPIDQEDENMIESEMEKGNVDEDEDEDENENENENINQDLDENEDEGEGDSGCDHNCR